MTRPAELADFAMSPEAGDDGVVSLALGEIARGFSSDGAGNDRLIGAGELNYMFNRVGAWVRYLAGEVPLRQWSDGPAGDPLATDCFEVYAKFVVAGAVAHAFGHVTVNGITVGSHFLDESAIGAGPFAAPVSADWDGVVGDSAAGSPAKILVIGNSVPIVATVNWDPLTGLSDSGAGGEVLGAVPLIRVRWSGSAWILISAESMWRSTDGGTWSDVTPALAGDILGLESDRAGHVIIVCAGGQVAHSSDDGATWTVVDLPVGAEGCTGVAMDATGTAVAFGAAGISISTNFGVTWSAFHPFPSSGLSARVAQVKGAWIVGTVSGVWTSTMPTGAPGQNDSGWTPVEGHSTASLHSSTRAIGRSLYTPQSGKVSNEVQLP